MTTRVFIFIFVYTVTVPSKYRRDIIVECVCKHVYVKLVRVYYCSKGTDVSQSAFRRRSSDRRRGKIFFVGKERRACVCVCVCVSQRRGQSEESASTMNWWKVRAVANSPENPSPGCEGMLVSGAEARGTSHL